MYLRLASEDPLTTTTKGEGIQVPAAMTGEEANITELIRTEVYLDVAGVEADDAGFRGLKSLGRLFFFGVDPLSAWL